MLDHSGVLSEISPLPIFNVDPQYTGMDATAKCNIETRGGMGEFYSKTESMGLQVFYHAYNEIPDLIVKFAQLFGFPDFSKKKIILFILFSGWSVLI